MHPESITNDNRAGILEIRWQDGELQRLGNPLLRASCQCADCKSARLAGVMPAVPSRTRITGIAPAGSYGIQLTFNDGHWRGIYPWGYLKQLKEQ